MPIRNQQQKWEGAVHFGESIKIPGKFLSSAARSIIAGTNVPIYSRNWFILQCYRNCKCKYLRTTNNQSQKKTISASAVLTGKFLRIRKVFVTCSLLAEEFPDNLEKCPDAIQNIQTKNKVSGWSGKYPDNVKSVRIIYIENVSAKSWKCPNDLESFLTI